MNVPKDKTWTIQKNETGQYKRMEVTDPSGRKNSLWTAQKTQKEQSKRPKVDGSRIKKEQPKESKWTVEKTECVQS